MKKISLVFAAFVLMVSLAYGQRTVVLTADSIANSLTESGYLQLPAVFDSISFSVYAMGEIDLDSLDIQGGILLNELDYKGARVSDLSIYEALDGATLTVDNAAGTATYVEGAKTVTREDCKGYNILKVSVISGAAGNDATDTTQKYIILAHIY
jgi:hypothetical protein